MTLCQFHDDSGAPIDAHFEAQSAQLTLHSRGGTAGSPKARNTDYGSALRMLLDRITRSELTLVGVWVDSNRVQNLSLEQRQVFFPEDKEVLPGDLFTRLSKRMVLVGRDPNGRISGGNSTKRIRFAFAGNPSDERIASIVGWGKVVDVSSHDGRLPAAELNKVGEDHIWRAVQRLLSGPVEHSYGESMHYHVIADDGTRLPPKAVFGLAASEALGFEVRPWHFKGGMGSPCFREITAAGFSILPKNELFRPNEVPPNAEDRIWAEGNPRFVVHLRRERGSGVARAKKQAFKHEHGRMRCEQCGLDPEKVYGSAFGDACIEVHHKLPLSEGSKTRKTKLEDLLCVCANCHRIIHYQLRNTFR